MPPKAFQLGKKTDVSKAEEPIVFKIPENVNDFLGNTDILDESNLQPTITNYERNQFLRKAKKDDDKLPKLLVESVSFGILNTDKINSLKVVNVSSNISRTEDIVDLIQKTSQFTGKKMSEKQCYKTEDKSQFAGEKPLMSSQSVTSYTAMGTVENNKICTTCYRTNVDCPGHLGEIKLHTSFAHPLFREYMLKVLSCVCNSCSALLVKESYLKSQGVMNSSGKGRLDRIFEIVSKLSGKAINPCPRQKIRKCLTNPKYVISSRKNYESYEILYRYANGSKEKLSMDINKVKQILNNISNEDAKILGFSNGVHPRDLIMESMAVIPPNARPYTIREGEIKEDHLTTAYDEIIRDNHKFSIVTDENRKRNIERDLYFHISHIIDNSDNKYCRSPTEKISGIKQRITKKEGLIRYNIMGKRVNFCGRSVLGPDSTLKFGEIAIPEAMTKVLTIPEMVHEKNYDYIMDLWDKRQIVNIQVGVNGVRQRVLEKFYNDDTVKPKIGYIVERYIRDGDVVLVNRQPTLYKYSMIGNFIKVVPKKTIGLHMTETKMRQADFDGDEANIHVIQTLDGRVEAATFANVQGCIPDSLINSSMIGQMQNSLSGAYMLTRNTVSNIEEIKQKYLKGEINALDYEMHKEIKLTQSEMDEGLNLITNKTDFNSLQKRFKKYNIDPLCGKALFSALLPKDFNYYRSGVIIKDGVLVSGVIKEDHIGKKGGAMHMSIWKWYGKQRAVDFITDCTFITDWFIYKHGLSIGFSDVNLPNNVTKKIDAIILKNTNDIKLKITTLPKIDNNSSAGEKSFIEKKILGYLDEFKKEVNKIGTEALSVNNPLNIMSDSGAKGSAGSTCNIVGLKGQETVFGERPVPKLNGGARCLPYFDFNSQDIKARGFISNSFIKGMTPSEMYFLSEGSRVGQLGTATTTAESGSLSHKLVKVLEDCKIAYDGSVRNANNNIYQLSYLDGYEVGESVITNSPSTGEVVSFINLKEAVEKINSSYL
jgi:DNA-directed RNA polymerase beta' subunit